MVDIDSSITSPAQAIARATTTRQLLNIEADAKTRKGSALGYLTGILYLAPGDISGREMCANRTPGCSAGCLYTAGRGIFRATQRARIAKTHELTANPVAFVEELAHNIDGLVRKARRRRMRPVVRLNGTSDLPWEYLRDANRRSLMARYPQVQFYDYTKNAPRWLANRLPRNYHLTFSRSENNAADCLRVLASKGNVAVVFSTRRGQPLPALWCGYRVIDGDLSDLRFLDRRGVVVGLRAKGPARHDASGFVVQTSRLACLVAGLVLASAGA